MKKVAFLYGGESSPYSFLKSAGDVCQFPGTLMCKNTTESTILSWSQLTLIGCPLHIPLWQPLGATTLS